MAKACGSLMAVELRFAFVEEGLHAFFLVVGGEERVEEFALELEAFVEAHFVGFEDGFLGELQGDRGHGSELFRQGEGFSEELLFGDDLGD